MINRFILSAVFLIGLLMACAAHMPLARNSFAVSQLPCYSNLLYQASAQADLVVMGSSRILTGVDPRPLAGTGDPTRAYNLAHNDRSYLTDRLLLDQVSRTHRPAIAIVEVYVPSATVFALERPAGFRRGASDVALAGGQHDRLAIAFGGYDALSITDGSTWFRARDRLSIAAAKIDQFAGLTLTGRLPWSFISASRLFERDAGNVCRRGRRTSTERNVGLRDRYIAHYRPAAPRDWQSWPADHPDFLTSTVDAPARRELATMVAIAKRRGIRIAFLYLPSKFIPPPDQDFVTAFAASFGAPLLVPPRSVLGALQADGYADEAHLNAAGRRLVSAWLGKMVERLRHAA